ncbi:phage tail sheath subtilisin-like domain-containing protein [Tunturibacter psychrotolerans]|uniref:Phage tail sheath subtilisin-like domain-containing protein n=1 Tax=Tunturiibacter psychrotolerans TaxID=3069686 RepID=A0AAU7ZRT5_9BACT
MTITTYLTPGVYRTPQVAPQPVLQLVRTDIAGFVGFAQRGPLPEDFPPATFDGSQAVVNISSWKQFLTTFGSFQEYGYLAYAVRAFFANGGKDCFVARVATTISADPTQNAARAFFSLPSGAPLPIGTVSKVVNPFVCVLAATVAPAVGDLLSISGGGITQLVHVAALLGSGQILLAASLQNSIAVGAAVSRFPGACRICAASRGKWGNTLRIQISPPQGATFALRVYVDNGPQGSPTEDEYYRNLTLTDPGSYNYAPAILQQQSNLIRLEVLGTAAPIQLSAAEPLSAGTFYLQGGRDGLAAITLNDFSGGPSDLRGLQLLEHVEQIGIVAIPDAVFETPQVLHLSPSPADECLPPVSSPVSAVASDPTAVATPLSAQDSLQLQRLMIDQCARLRYRVALIDPPDMLQIGAVQTWPLANGFVGSPSSRFAAIYYPWLASPDALQLDGPTRNIPPSGYIAGAYAQTDLAYGVQRPPANVELQFVVDVEQAISDLQQQGLNLNNINAIRTFPGRGIRVWGARSLAPASDDNWRFIHVRRLMSAIEETVERSSRWVVFQSNDDALRSSLTHSLTVLLTGIWSKGGLQGAKPADAFYVKCDTTNNPQTAIDQGQLICQIGIAIAAPMEFLVFEIRQDASGAQVVES